MSDRRGEILNQENIKFYETKVVHGIYRQNYPTVYETASISAMDEYMKEVCLELLEYMAKNKVVCGVFSDDRMFNYKGQWITKEQLFENFL